VTEQTASALPPVVDRQTWQAALDDLRVREKAATRELDAIAAQRERSFGADVGAPPGAGFAVNVFLRDGDDVYCTWHTDGHGTEQLSYTFGLIDILPWGRQEEWQDLPDGWPKSPTYPKWLDSPDVALALRPERLK
jgi:predicted dithiol-disulfide oxidoreductase (DUF899 family)